VLRSSAAIDDVIAARRGVFIAIVALARELAGSLFAMWRTHPATT
jgi:hypothetical protein